MPRNVDNECFGICVVIEHLLETPPCDEERAPISAEELADAIYRGITEKADNCTTSQVATPEGPLPIEGQEAVDRLCAIIDKRYVGLYRRLLASREGRHRLADASKSCLKTEKELADLLDADRDGIASFCGFGKRTFVDGRIAETNHAFMLSADGAGGFEVFDPNAPGVAHPCRVTERGRFVEAEWECEYKLTGEVTRQRYRITPTAKYLRIITTAEL